MNKIIKKIAVVAVVIFFLFFCITIFSVLYARNNLNFALDEELFESKISDKNTVFYVVDEDGDCSEIYRMGKDGADNWYELNEINQNVINAFLSSEDREFYKHKGINYRRTLMAVGNKLLRRSNSFGGSTITQQTIKNLSGNNEKTIKRKYNEFLRALNIEKRYSKDQILELYLNIVPMTGDMHGVGGGSRAYFGKKPSELSVEEAATLAAITNSPAKYHPVKHPEACLKKRNTVLYAMYKNGCISYDEYTRATNTGLGISIISTNENKYNSWFIETAVEEIITDLMREYNLSGKAARMLLANDMEILLTMDPNVQDLMQNYFNDVRERYNIIENLEMSMVIYNSRTGNPVGIVGSCGIKNANLLFNYATALHPPASTLKPLALYAPLIDRDEINWATVFDDIPVETKKQGDKYISYPRNSPNFYNGLITVKDALRSSKNTIALQLYEKIGARQIYCNLTNDYGIDSLVENRLDSNQNTLTDIAPAPLAFGQLTDGISLTKLTHCYTVFPNYGTLRGGKTYIYVRDKNGKNILSNESENKIYDIDSSQLMNMLLSQVVDYGTASKVKLKELIDVAGKTGTSSGDLDRLFIGYTPYYTGGVWIGGKNKRVGIDISYPIHLNVWDDVMSEIHNRLVFEKYGDDIDSFETDMLVQCEYCKDSGMLCSEICFIDERSERSEIGYFKRNCKPTQICDKHTIISNINSDRVAVIHDRVQSEYYTTLDAEYIVDKNREK